MKLDKYTCDGQMCLDDFLKPVTQDNEPPVLLEIGQDIYKVIRGDVIEMYVYDEKPWLCGENERGYRLKVKGGCYDCAWNKSIGVDTFTDKEQAYRVAEEYLKSHECIRKEDIKAIKTIAYSYVRNTDNREMIAFYSVLKNGLMYVKEFMTFHHLVEHNAKNIKKFMSQQEFEYVEPKQFEYQPIYKNMYPCRKDVNWLYAEARYTGCK